MYIIVFSIQFYINNLRWVNYVYECISFIKKLAAIPLQLLSSVRFKNGVATETQCQQLNNCSRIATRFVTSVEVYLLLSYAQQINKMDNL